jgi:hypothetical protein
MIDKMTLHVALGELLKICFIEIDGVTDTIDAHFIQRGVSNVDDPGHGSEQVPALRVACKDG